MQMIYVDTMRFILNKKLNTPEQSGVFVRSEIIVLFYSWNIGQIFQLVIQVID